MAIINKFSQKTTTKEIFIIQIIGLLLVCCLSSYLILTRISQDGPPGSKIIWIPFLIGFLFLGLTVHNADSRKVTFLKGLIVGFIVSAVSLAAFVYWAGINILPITALPIATEIEVMPLSGRNTGNTGTIIISITLALSTLAGGIISLVLQSLKRKLIKS